MENIHFEALYPSNSREKEIEKILTFIKEGKSCQVVSLPGVGRSNLLGLLSFNRNVRIKFFGKENQKWYHFVLCNFSEVKNKSLFEAEKYLFLSLVDSMRERKMTDEYQRASKIFKESLNFNDELVLFQGLKKTIDLLAIEKQFTIVFLFDRFEKYVPKVTSDFFSNLRILRNRAKYRFSAVFSLNRPLEESIEPELFADFHEFLAGHTIYLPLFDKPLMDFRIGYVEKITEKKIDKKVLEKIIELTAGHGKLTILSVEAALAANKSEYQNPKSKINSKTQNPNNQNVSNLDIRISNLASFLLQQKTVRGALLEIWYSLTPSEQNMLVFSNERLAFSSLEEMSYLENVGLLKNGKIVIKLFEEFITRLHKDLGEAREDKIFFDQTRGEIVKGDLFLSNKLTSSEFKLLRFLLQNPERVVEREEIINAVWHDSKSTAGVTDQALDQLIFRLRKKIETDPNSPTHIQTIKGRGIKFTA